MGPRSDWESYIQDIADDIFTKQTPGQLYLIREKLHGVLKSCIPPELVLRQLVQMTQLRFDERSRYEVTSLAALFNQRLQEQYNPIFHLEGFVMELMYIHKRFLNNSVN